MINLYYKSVAYFSQHPILNSLAHAAGGFGLALLLQYYIQGTAFVPVVISGGLVAVSVVIHILSLRGS